MSLITPELLERPQSFTSSHMYESYLWLGHCVHNPADYYEGLMAYHEDQTIADEQQQRFEERIAVFPERILLDQFSMIVARARNELKLQTPLKGAPRRQLQVYLAGEVTTIGESYAEQEGLYEDAPQLKNVKKPLADVRVIDGVMRYRQYGKITQSLIGYATMDKLLPGYNR